MVRECSRVPWCTFGGQRTGFEGILSAGRWLRTPLIPALGILRQVDLCGVEKKDKKKEYASSTMRTQVTGLLAHAFSPGEPSCF